MIYNGNIKMSMEWNSSIGRRDDIKRLNFSEIKVHERLRVNRKNDARRLDFSNTKVHERFRVDRRNDVRRLDFSKIKIHKRFRLSFTIGRIARKKDNCASKTSLLCILL
jgi:hypothetical protein